MMGEGGLQVWSPAAHRAGGPGSILENTAVLHQSPIEFGETDMATMTVTARGQVTFRKEVLQHLGIRPGETITLDLLPNGRAELRAERLKGSWKDLKGLVADKTNGARLSNDEIGDAIAEAGAAAGLGET